MIDRATIEQLPIESQEGVKIAFGTLYASGILKLQINLNKLVLIDGFDQDADLLKTRILEAQQVNRVLLALHQLGETLVKDSRHE